MFVAAALLLSPVLTPPALPARVASTLLPQQEAGFESLQAELANRTAARRQAAREAWGEHGPAYMKQPSKGTMAPLIEVAPEIQDPLLDALHQRLDTKPIPVNEVQSLLFLLQQVVDSGGASRLLDALDKLPAGNRPDVLRNAVARGNQRTIAAARIYLSDQNPDLREAALESLLLYDRKENLQELADRIDLKQVNPELFALTLEELTGRELPEGFHFPTSIWVAEQELIRGALATFLQTHPQDDSETFLITLALDESQSLPQRQRALDAYVVGGNQFRWKSGVRDLERYLKDGNRDKASVAVAWALHHLGERRGRRFLLAGPEEKAKRNPDDWQVQLELGRMQVDVAEFADAYRTFKRTFDSIDNTPIARRLQPLDYLYASRAAAGSGHRREAGDWLSATNLSRQELAPYRDLPEYADYLKREPFSRLFPAPAE